MPSLTTGSSPVIPQPAATILLLRDHPFQVLMIRRHEKQVFGSALVFPGGLVQASDHSDSWLPLVVDADRLDTDERALRIAAFRETFEETGILLARDGAGRCVRAVPTSGEFIDTVLESGGRLFMADLVRFGHWITPSCSPRRFDTHFFLSRMAEDQEAVCDGGEAVGVEWAQPADILERAAIGESAILFPTRMNVCRLAEQNDVESALAAWRGRSVVTVRPLVEQREDGTAFVIPADAGYPGTEHFVRKPPPKN